MVMKRYVALLLVLAACGPGTRAVTPAEADRLSHVRTIQRAGITAHVPTGAGPVVLTGHVDFAHRTGDVTMTTEGRTDPDSRGPLRWDTTSLTFAGQTRPLRRDGSELDTALLLLANLHAAASDPAELQRTLQWLRTDTLAGTQVDVFAGDHLTYWVDTNGTLRRLEARLASDPQPAVVDLSPSP
ncbi:hypothetical protein GCM10029964_118810 [Kibdelosporangium lantanae]